jgi:uncharacterized membrane protein
MRGRLPVFFINMNQFTASLWGDEAFSAILSMKSVPDIIKIIIRDTSPPLYNLSEHFWFTLFGTSEVAIRSLSFIYYLIAIFFVYKIGEYLWDKKTGFLAAALAFFNPFFFIYAFEGRMYSILAAGVCMSMYFFISRKWVGYVIGTLLALYSHHFSIFAVFAQGLWFLKELIFGKKKVAFSMFKSFVAIGIFYTPWLYPLYLQMKMVGGGFWLGVPTVKEFFALIGVYLATGTTHPFSKITLTALVLILVTLSIKRWSVKIEKNLFLLSWFIIPILATWLISQKFTPIFYDRYLLYTIPAAMLLVGSSRRRFSIFTIALSLIAFLVIDYNYFTHPTKRPFKELATYVKEVKQGDDYLINWNSAAHHLWETKYYGIPAPIYIPSKANLPYFVGTALMEKDDIISSLPKAKRIGVVTSGSPDEVTLAGYTKKETKTFGVLKFIWYQKNK